jgi:hypothetical protein
MSYTLQFKFVRTFFTPIEATQTIGKEKTTFSKTFTLTQNFRKILRAAQKIGSDRHVDFLERL